MKTGRVRATFRRSSRSWDWVIGIVIFSPF